MLYLDNTATTRPFIDILTQSAQTIYENFGNPSSIHSLGMNAEKLLENSRKSILNTLKFTTNSPDNIFNEKFTFTYKPHKVQLSDYALIFTSGGTESNNTVFGSLSPKGNRDTILLSKTEHPSVLSNKEMLEKKGFKVKLIGVRSDGVIDIAPFLGDIAEKKVLLLSVHHINNETGTIQPIPELISALKTLDPQLLVHTDCVQSFMKTPLPYADFISVSAHKIHALKGTGALIYRKNIPIKPLILGGSQEHGKRGGTENILGILVFSEAVKRLSTTPMDFSTLRKGFISRLGELIEFELNGQMECYAFNNIINISIRGIRPEVIIHMLEKEEMFISSVAACSSKKVVSHVIEAMGGRGGESLRISFTHGDDESCAIRAAELLAGAVNEYHKMVGIKKG